MKAIPALIVDVVAIVVFAILGRSSHAEANTLLGVLGTAWPFLVGVVTAHAICQLAGNLRGDPTGWRQALAVWAGTVGLGMLLRLASGDTAAWSFVIVASIVLGCLLIGWRRLFRLAQRARTRTDARV